MLAAPIGRRSEYTQRLPPPMKSSAAVIEVVVGPVVHGHALRRQAVPAVQVEGEERGHRRAGGVREVVPADLAVIVRQALREGLRRREQQQPRVLVGVGREQHHLGRLEELLLAGHVGDPGDLALVVHLDLRDVRFGHDLEAPGLLRARNRRDVRAVLGVHVAAAAIAEAVVHARRAVLVAPGVDGRRAGERVPAERLGRCRSCDRDSRCCAAAASGRAAGAAPRRCCRAGRWCRGRCRPGPTRRSRARRRS